jgi:hypothetical protein
MTKRILLCFLIGTMSTVGWISTGCTPRLEPSRSESSTTTIETSHTKTKHSSQPAPSVDQTKTVAIKITGMMCQASCFADVKMLMEKHNKIESIELVEQQDSNLIDRPIVVVQYRGTLDREAITKAMLGAGFKNVEYDVDL